MSYAARLSPLFLALASLSLVHCGDWTDPDHAEPVAKLDLDPNQLPDASPAGKPLSIGVAMIQKGPGECRWADAPGNGLVKSCNLPEENVAFTISSVACDDGLCDVSSIEPDPSGFAATVTIVPRADSVTVHITATSGSLTATGGFSISPNCMREVSGGSCLRESVPPFGGDFGSGGTSGGNSGTGDRPRARTSS